MMKKWHCPPPETALALNKKKIACLEFISDMFT
jgi:hypothetical protein